MLGFPPFVYLLIWSCICSLEKGTGGGRTGEDAQAAFPLWCVRSCFGPCEFSRLFPCAGPWEEPEGVIPDLMAGILQLPGLRNGWGAAETFLAFKSATEETDMQIVLQTLESLFFKFFFFIYFLLLLNNLWSDGRQTQCNVQKQEHSFNFHLQFPGCRADSWVTLSVLELISLGFTLREIYLAGAKPSYIS